MKGFYATLTCPPTPHPTPPLCCSPVEGGGGAGGGLSELRVN